MLKKVVITNYLGESMEYRIDGVEAENPSGLIITSIDGLGPVKANINMTDLTTTDGQMYNSARLSGRNIVIKALFTHATSIEEARLLSYKYFPVKKKLKFRIETDNRIGETEGYVESNEPDIFSEQSGCQVSILCENPYFDGGKVGYTFGDTVPLFKFKFGNEDLDEPLIKLSEEAEVTGVREIVYEGDTDAGMEIAVEVPTDDLLDTFSIKGIEIQGDKGSIKIDTSKMNTQVPNSAPNDTPRSQLAFIFDNNRHKCLQILSEEARDVYPITYKGNVQCFYYCGSEGLRRMQWNLGERKWIEIGMAPSLGDQPTWLLCLNDKIYAYVWNAYRIYKLNEETNTWDVVVSVSGPASEAYCHVATVYRNAIHCFDVDLSGSNRTNCHRIFTGSSLYVASDNENMKTVLSSGGSYYFGHYNMENQACAIVYNDELHILGGTIGISGGNSNRHFVWDGTASGWSELTNDTLPADVTSGCNCATVYQGKIHILSGSHFTWDPQNGFVELYDLPHGLAFTSGQRNYTISDSDYIYSFGYRYYNVHYTEEANNIKLIENDKLVINTIKGKKGVTLYRGTNKYNVLNALDKDSTWLQLQRGVNRFSYTAEEGADDIQITISTNKWYEGV